MGGPGSGRRGKDGEANDRLVGQLREASARSDFEQHDGQAVEDAAKQAAREQQGGRS